MNKVEERGFLSWLSPEKIFAYLLEIEEEGGTKSPMLTLSFLSFLNLTFIFSTKAYHFAYERLGAHLLEVGGIKELISASGL